MKEEVNQEETLTSWSCTSQGGHIPPCPWLIPTWSPGDNNQAPEFQRPVMEGLTSHREGGMCQRSPTVGSSPPTHLLGLATV